MQWKHTFKHVHVSDSLKFYAEEVFEKDSRLLLKDSQWQIFYSKGKQGDCCVEVTVRNGTGHFKATAHAESFYLAVDEAALKLSRQFQKKKERLQHHKDPTRSRQGKLDRLNAQLEYDSHVLPVKKSA
jgi:ribosomal subunit interface protein